MSTIPPGGDPRFGPADPSLTSPPAPTPSAASAAPPFGSTATGSWTAVAVPATAPAPRPKTGTPTWLVAAVVGLIGLLGLTCFAIYHHQSQSDAAKRQVFEHTRVSTPATVLGLQQGVGPGMESAQTRMNLALAQGGAVDPVYAAYIDGDGNSYAVVAGARRVTTPADLRSTAQKTADHFSSGIGSSGSTPFTVSEVAAGDLGGVMLCGATTIAQLPSTYCVAVDEGSVTEFLIGTGDQAEGAGSASSLRLAMVQRTG